MNVVIAGGGVAALEATMALRDLAGDGLEIALVAPDEEFVFRPMAVGAPFALGEPRRVALDAFARDFSATLVRAPLRSVSPDEHTIAVGDGEEVAYEQLLVATGARRVPAFEHVTTFRGQEDAEALHGLVQDVEGGYTRRIAFVVPAGISWTLPLYELALLTAGRAHEMNLEDVELTLVTPEDRPLSVFGSEATAEVERRFEAAGIRILTAASPEIPRKGRVVAHPSHDEIECDRIVALPRIEGPTIDGLPHEGDGFIPIDSHCRVFGADDVWAAGDGTNFPVKQGGLACQQADAAAESIAAAAGEDIEPRPFRPVLRGLLLTGDAPQAMRARLGGGPDLLEEDAEQMLWWPPAKIAGRYLAPYLDSLAGASRWADLGAGADRGTPIATDDPDGPELREYELEH